MILFLELPEFESFHFDLDPSFPRPPPEPLDVEISLIIETDAPVINNFDALNEDESFDPGGDEIDVEDDDSFTFVIQTFLPLLTYPEVSPLLSSTRNEDTIFDPGTDKAKITRKRLKPGKHEHRNGRAHKESGESYQSQEWSISILTNQVLPAEEQPLPAAASPTADSPGYVPESDPEEDPEEDDDEDPEEDPADYPADGGDDGDDEDESSDDDEDDDVDIEGDEEEEEHPAPADSTAVALPAVDHALSAEETEPFETDESAATPPPHPAYRVTARISIRDEPPTPFWSDTEVARLLAIPTPPPSPLSPWSSPLPQIPSPPLPVSPPPPASPTYPLGYRAAMIRLRAEAPSTSHSPPPHIILSHTRADTPPSGTPPSGTPPLLPIPLPTSSPSLLLPSADHGADRPEVCLPPRKRLCFAFGPRYEVGESSSAAAARPTGGFRADYGFVATMDREIRRDLERDVGYGITDT
ncbi:hypothetical protein Tco_0060444 [Tanacetum coccineum]